MRAHAHPHLAVAHVDRFEVSCEGEPIEAFPSLDEAQRFAQWSAGLSDCPHEIFDAETRVLLERVEPLFVP